MSRAPVQQGMFSKFVTQSIAFVSSHYYCGLVPDSVKLINVYSLKHVSSFEVTNN